MTCSACISCVLQLGAAQRHGGGRLFYIASSLMELPRDNVLEEVAMQCYNIAWASGQ